MKQIKLVNIFGSNIVTRNSLDSLFSKIKKYKSKEIEIDFDKIDFISRSSADEYLKLKDVTRKIIKEVNMTDKVKDMFNVVTSPSQVKFNMTSVKIVNI